MLEVPTGGEGGAKATSSFLRTSRQSADPSESGGRSHHESEASEDSTEAYSSLTNNKRLFANSENACLKCLSNYLQAPSFYKHMKPRQRSWFFCIISEIVIALALLWQFMSFRGAMHQLLLEQVNHELRLLDTTWQRKTEQVALVEFSRTQNPNINAFAKGIGMRYNYTGSNLQHVMRTDLGFLSVEYGMLLNTDARIVVDITHNRTGEHFDPFGLVSQVIAHPERGTLKVSRLVPWSELLNSQAKIYREQFTAMADNARTHPFDNHDVSLMRYTLAPIFENTNGTGRLTGVFLAGDIVNGKNVITWLTTTAFQSGFSGLYTLKGDGSGYRRASTSLWLPETQPRTAPHDTSTHDPITPELHDTLLKAAGRTPDAVVSFIKDGYAWAATTPDLGTWNDTKMPNEVPPAVMVRALYLANDHTFSDLLKNTWYWLVLMLLVNVLSVHFSTGTFIAPLEEVAATLKANAKQGISGGGRKVTIKQLNSLDLYAQYLLRVCITLATALVCAIMISTQIRQSMKAVVGKLTLSELGIGKVTYNLRGDQTSAGITCSSAQPLITRLVGGPNNTFARNRTHAYLGRETKRRKLTFLSVYDKSNRVISSINKKMLDTHIDPADLAAMTLKYNVMYKTTARMSYAEFTKLKPPFLPRHNMRNVVDSKLDPYTTKKDAIIRWTTVPVYTEQNPDQMVADGVIVAGDLLSGMTDMCEDLLQVTGAGYVAHFAPDDEGGFYMLNSVLVDRTTGEAIVDIPMADLDVVRRSAANDGAPALAWTTIHGKNFAVAASRVTVDRLVGKDGQLDMNTPPVAYVVYGKDSDTTKKLENEQATWVAVMAVLQVLMMMMLNYVSYLPFHKLLTVLEDKGFADRKNRPTILRVLKVYTIDATRRFVSDLRSHSARENFQRYVAGPTQSRIKRLRRRVRHMLGFKGKNGHPAPQVKSHTHRNSSSALRSSKIVATVDAVKAESRMKSPPGTTGVV